MYVKLGQVNWASISYSLAKISAISVLIPLIAGLFRLNQLKPYLKMLLLLLGWTALVEAIMWVLASSGSTNIFLIPLLVLIEFPIIIIIYRKVYKDSPWKRLLIFIPIAFTIFVVWNVLFGEGARDLGSFIRIIEGLLIISLTLVWFFQAFNDTSIKAIHREPMFWISAGFLVYSAGTFFLSITSAYMLETNEGLLVIAYSINSIANIVKNLLFTVALWMPART